MTDTPGVYSGHRFRPLAEVKDRAARLASALSAHGVRHGDRYAIVMRNEVGFLEASLAASLIGAVPIPVNWHWTKTDLRHVLHDSGCTAAIVHSDLVPGVEQQAPEGLAILEAEVPPEVTEAYDLGEVPATGRHPTVDSAIAAHDPVDATTADAPMAVIYTSGTTGLAKGILRNRVPAEDMPKLVNGVGEALKLQPGGVTLLPAPLYHTAPNVQATFAVALGMTLVMMPKFDPEQFLALVEKHHVTSVQMVPTMFNRLLRLPAETRQSYDLSSLQAVVHAAAPCPPEVKRAMITWLGPIVHEYYGGSEGGPWVQCDSDEALAHPGTVGRPIREARVRIVGPDGQDVPTGEVGVVYGRSIAGWPDFTYLGDDAKRRAIELDGYITVGDMGYVDADGFLYLTDRISDMVISGGVNIYPAEIEACLLTLEGVADAAVFGIPDPDLGEALAAHIQLLPGAVLTEEQVRTHVTQRLARYKNPKVVVFDEELPREDTGKLFKRRLKDRYRQSEATNDV